MAYRVTSQQMISQFLGDLQKTQYGMARTQREISTGQRINSPSDDPFGSAQVMTLDAQLNDITAYQRNVQDALGFLDTTDDALGGVGSVLGRVRELIVQASNSTYDQSGLNSVAAEITQLKESLRDKANTRFGTTYVFSGTATSTQPYPPPANAYAGNVGLINRRVSPGLQVTINTPGPSVFGTTTGALPSQMSMFDLMDRIVADLTSGVPADREELRTLCLDAVDTNIDNVLRERANMGAASQRLQVTEERLGSLEQQLMEARSSIADTDLARSYVELQSQNTMYQSALAAGARILNTSLLDFL